jgi:hypothetical protein
MWFELPGYISQCKGCWFFLQAMFPLFKTVISLNFHQGNLQIELSPRFEPSLFLRLYQDFWHITVHWH